MISISMLRFGASRKPGEPVRIGFIGSGGIAERHANILKQFPDVVVKAVSSPGQGAKTFAQKTGAHAYSDPKTMLANEELDALFICVPPAAHGEPEKLAIENNLPFFVEKPLAVDAKTAEEINEGVEKKNLVTAVGYQWRYMDTVDRIRDFLKKNPPQLVIAHWLGSLPPPKWWRKQDQSGGQIVEQATHFVDLLRDLVGEITSVHAMGKKTQRKDFPDADVDSASSAVMRFDNGAVGSLTATSLLPKSHKVGVELIGEGYAFTLSGQDLKVLDEQGTREEAADGQATTRIVRDFIDAVEGKPNHIRSTYQDAMKTHRVTLAMARSAAEDRPIDLQGAGTAP